jgi:feruloyl-CoA synthase
MSTAIPPDRSPPPARYRPAHFSGCTEATVEARADGARIWRSTEALQAYPGVLTERLEHWAETTPDRVFAAERNAAGDWETVSYAQMRDEARRIGQALLDLPGEPLSAERPLVILADNNLDHLRLSFGALWVGIPFAPVSPAYALVATDFAKLRHIIATLTPGLVYVADGQAYARALADCVPPEVPVVSGGAPVPGRETMALSALRATEAGAAAARAHAALGPDTIAKFLFTSGSTKQPKAVVNTHRMWCSNLQMIRQCFPFLADEPPVLVDWLPWNHTFGGNHNIGITLYNGGSLYLDAGKPTPGGIAATVRNLREMAPTMYFNVPKGFEELCRAMDHDTALRDSLFSRVQAFMYAGAGLSQGVWDHLDRHAEAAIGERVFMTTGLGMTETAPSCTFAVGAGVRSGHIGLPCPGVEVKLVPDAASGKQEIRFRGPNVMPGYWRNPEASAEAFDEQGYYRTGDAARCIDDADPALGLAFDGRIAEDFKLSSGTFVSVGPLRARVTLAGDPFVQDVVVAGLDRDAIGLLLFPRLDDLRRHHGLPASMPAAEVLADPRVRGVFQALADRMWREGTGSATRPARWMVLSEPPSIDRGELTDKNSINQRAVLAARAALVDRLYADPPAPEVIVPAGAR